MKLRGTIINTLVLCYNRNMVSRATEKNWERLGVNGEGRLCHRANKSRSKRYSDVCSEIRGVVEYIRSNGIDVFSAIYSLGIGLLEVNGIYEKSNVREVLGGYCVKLEKKLIGAIKEFELLGLVYEGILREGERNIGGIYYTPKEIILDMVGEIGSGERFLDPSCGGGGFLLGVGAESPEQIYGVDIDRIGVFISQLGLLLKYREFDFIPNVFCCDYMKWEMGKFDCIVTNPPYGKIGGKERFSLFFERGYEQLKEGGRIKYLFPESIMNVKTHCDIRKKIMGGLVGITKYKFGGVYTDCVGIECVKGSNNGKYIYSEGVERKEVTIESIGFTKNCIFNNLVERDIQIIKKVYEKGVYTLEGSLFGLGIVTGDNRGKVLERYIEGSEKIYTGKEIGLYRLKDSGKYIVYDRGVFQQVAEDKLYRSEKLLYKFISDRLVFSYDGEGVLCLNSANFVIPSINGMSVKTVCAFLNSSLYSFLYRKLFGGVKILKGNLLELKFPEIEEEMNKRIEGIVEKIIESGEGIGEIDDIVYEIFGIDDCERAYIESCVNN